MIYKVPQQFVISDNFDEFANMEEVQQWVNSQKPIPSLFIIHCFKGSIELRINEKNYIVHQHGHFVMPPYFRINQYKHTNDFDCVILCSSEELCNKSIEKNFLRDMEWMEVMDRIRHHPVIPLDENQEKLCQAYFSFVHAYTKILPEGKPDSIFLSVMELGMMLFCGILKEQLNFKLKKSIPTAMRHRDLLYMKFTERLQKEVSYQSATAYANTLCISPKYLNDICKRKSGKTASQIITAHILEHIKSDLKNTSKTIKELSDRYNFSTQSNFSKFVRVHLGMSPLEYRKSVRNE